MKWFVGLIFAVFAYSLALNIAGGEAGYEQATVISHEYVAPVFLASPRYEIVISCRHGYERLNDRKLYDTYEDGDVLRVRYIEKWVLGLKFNRRFLGSVAHP